MQEGWAFSRGTGEDPDENMGTSDLCHLLQTLSLAGRAEPFSHQTQFQAGEFPSPLRRAALQGFAISVSLLPAGSSVGTAAVPEGHF